MYTILLLFLMHASMLVLRPQCSLIPNELQSMNAIAQSSYIYVTRVPIYTVRVFILPQAVQLSQKNV